ncbi:IclR family transcriptional regulator [Nocardioides sp. cx-169]|nr:IclR family transcriptional regulator [Nocardioides sp. cx-169]
MDAFQGGPRTISLGELSVRTSLPKSTLHRLTEQLCSAGWIERDPSGYRIGLRLFELGSLAVEGTRLHDAAAPHLRALAAKTGMAVQLAILDGAEIVYLDRVTSSRFKVPSRRGGRKPAYCTGLGKALFAFDNDALDAVFSAPMPARTASTITDAGQMWAEVRRIRESGVAYDKGEAHDGLICVASPVRDAGRALAAVSVTGPKGQVQLGSVSEEVRRTSAAIWNATCSTTPQGRGSVA